MNARRWAMRDRLVGRLQDNLSATRARPVLARWSRDAGGVRGSSPWQIVLSGDYYDGHGVGRVRPEIMVRWHRCGWRISAMVNVVHAQYHLNRVLCDQ